MTDLKYQIEASLAGFKSKDLKQASMTFLNTLGYRSEKVLDLENTPAAFLAQFDHRDRPLRKDKALSHPTHTLHIRPAIGRLRRHISRATEADWGLYAL